MTTAVRPVDLQYLGHLLQERLQLKFFPNGSVEVKCLRKQETLIVVGQHLEVAMPEPQKVFSSLEQIIKALQLEWTHKVQLYLKVDNKKNPYAFHTFTMKSPDGISLDFLPEELVSNQEGALSPLGDALATDDSDWLSADIWELNEEAPSPQFGARAESTPSNVEQPASPEEAKSPTAVEMGAKGSRQSNTMLPAVVTGASVTVLTLLLGVYPLSRPCVLGKCEEIKTARKLNESSLKLLKESKSALAPVEAQKKLVQSSELLKTIPFWSFYYPEAQNLLDNAESQIEDLEAAIDVQKKASSAAQKSQNPPHSAETWQEVQSLWREAIAQLEQIPDDSELYAWRERKLNEYNANLKAINQRLKIEQQAEKKLKAAKSTAQIAQTRQGVAQSLDSWQLVYSSWQTAVNTLQQIPKGTQAEQEARQLLESYKTKLAESSDRKTTEQIGATNYNQSLRIADNAQLAEKRNQWSTAVALWRQAQNYAQKVPSGSDYYGRAQQLQASHNNFLLRAQSKLQVAVSMQQARTDLKKTCGGSPKVCDFAVTSDLMTVYITSDYQRSIRQTAQTADKKRDFKTRQKVDNHIQTLQTALEAISSNANIPISVFSPSGSLIGSYNPRF